MDTKNNSSFALFLNIVLGILLVGTIVFSYFFGNFGGISIIELKENYVIKEDIKFSDLPDIVKDEYIKKDEIVPKANTIVGLEKVFDQFGNPIEVVEGNIDDLQVVIKSLQERVLFLEQENLLISNDKNELLKIVQKEKSKAKIEESNLLSKNLEKINEAEHQHYKNISELTMKINDLQRENISLSDRLNREKQDLFDTIEKLKKDIKNQKDKAKLTESEVLKKQAKKYKNLEIISQKSKEKIDKLSRLLQDQRDREIIENAKKDKQIVGLQNKINSLIIEKNTLLTQNSKSVLELEKKSSQKLQKIEQTIKQYQEDKQSLKQSYEKLLSDSRENFDKSIKSLKLENQNLKDEIRKLSQNSVLILENSEKALSSKDQEYKKLLVEAKRKLQTDVEKIVKDKDIVQAKLDTQNSELLKAQEVIKALKLKDQKRSDTILQLNDKFATLSKQNRSVDSKVKELVTKNEKKHNENYKFLNQQIASLERQLTKEVEVKSKSIKRVETNYDTKLKKLDTKYSQLLKDYGYSQKDIKEKSLKIVSLEKTIKKLESQKQSLELSEHEKLKEIKKSFEEIQESMKIKETKYKEKIASLNNRIKAQEETINSRVKDKEKLGKYLREITSLKKTLKVLEGQIVSSDTVPISDKKRKLALLGSIECDDMNSGNFKVSSSCKKRVSEFLGQYDATNYFEVIPIVGKGGFGSLNLVKKKTNLVSDSEIDRLTGLANLGLGKHRAKEGGWLIREQFGDFAKISYTVYNIESDNKRGFVIKVYR